MPARYFCDECGKEATERFFGTLFGEDDKIIGEYRVRTRVLKNDGYQVEALLCSFCKENIRKQAYPVD